MDGDRAGQSPEKVICIFYISPCYMPDITSLFYFCRVQRILTAILAIIFLAQTFNQGLLYLDYMVDKAEYLKQCENKSRPQLHCDGKCLLMKRIREQEQKEQQKAPEMKVVKAETGSNSSSFAQCPPALSTPDKTIYFPFTTGTPVDQPRSLFHPPDC